MTKPILTRFRHLQQKLRAHTKPDRDGRNFCLDPIPVGKAEGFPEDSYIKRGSALEPHSPDVIQVMTPVSPKAGKYRQETFAQLPGSLFSWSPKLHHFIKNGGEVKGDSPAQLPDVAYSILDGAVGSLLHYSIGYDAEDKVASLQNRVGQRIR